MPNSQYGTFLESSNPPLMLSLSRGVSTVSMDKEFQFVELRYEQYGHPGMLRIGQLLRDSEDSLLVSNIDKVCQSYF